MSESGSGYPIQPPRPRKRREANSSPLTRYLVVPEAEGDDPETPEEFLAAIMRGRPVRHGMMWVIAPMPDRIEAARTLLAHRRKSEARETAAATYETALRAIAAVAAAKSPDALPLSRNTDEELK